jgi:Mlc titration factor MtfA (ptsG expression regulator)
MLFRWLRKRRRQKWILKSFPDTWEQILVRNVAHYAALDSSETARLRQFIQIFVAEKIWEGCGGLEMNDEVRVTISAQAGLLVLGLPHQYFQNVQSILVYPSTVITPPRHQGSFGVQKEVVRDGVPILGEAQLRGPVLLVWDAVKQNARHPERGHDVVYHEFAHKLDMLDGTVDGTPPLASRAAIERWSEVCGREYNALRKDVGRARKTFLDAYGATNEAEFFAVATEQFFNRPERMQREEPDLYELLRDFYQQDTAARSRI